LQGELLDNHSLKLSVAKSSKPKDSKLLGNKVNRENSKTADYDYEGEDAEDSKLLLKNLAFEANLDELKELLSKFGEVKTLRIPKKLNGEHRGFGFAEFVSHEEAKNVFKNMSNTHFYGRKLVIEWAQKDKTVEELREDTLKKVKTLSIQTHTTRGKTVFDKQAFANKKKKNI